jgi:predicted molibdopterin-dependent oxidoreductase YjgC
VAAAANLALVTGNVGKAGSGILPLSEYNNVQGAMDMGALPDHLPGYQPLPDGTSPGLDAMEMIKAAAAGELKGLLIMGENPMTAFPDRELVQTALEKLDFLVVQDIFLTDTAKLADVVLPATAGPEKNGTFTNTDRRVQRVQKAIEPPPKTRPDWKILCELLAGFGQPVPFKTANQITAAIAREIPSYAGITPERLVRTGLHWPCPDSEHPGTSYLYGDGFPGGKGKVRPVEQSENGRPTEEYPFTLISGMILFHSGTTTKWAGGLNELAPEARAEINPHDAKDLDIAGGDRITVKSDKGQIQAVADITPRVPKGTVFVPAHYSGMSVSSLMGYDPVREKTVTFISVAKA